MLKNLLLLLTICGSVQAAIVNYISSNQFNLGTNAIYLAAINNVYNVRRYGAVGDGTTDDTVAVKAAYDAIDKTKGGELFFPGDGQWKYNLVITNHNITITGQSHYRDGFVSTLAMRSRHIPADITRPVIQIGNDTDYVRGTLIRTCNFYGASTGAMGLYFYGGAFEASVENCTVQQFAIGIKTQGGTTYPCSLIRFSNVDGQPANVADARGWAILNTANYPTSYTTEINLNNCHWDGPSSGSNSYVMEVDSCEMKIVNTYFDISNGHGVKLSNTILAADTWVHAVNCNFDAGVSTNVVIEGFDNNRNFGGLQGVNCQLSGSWKELDGTIIAPLPQNTSTILRRNASVRGVFRILNLDSSTTSSQLQFADNINNLTPDFLAQNGSIYARPAVGGGFIVAKLTGGNLFQVNETGATFLFGAGITNNVYLALDNNRQIVTATNTGTGSLVLSNAPTILSPNITSGTLSPAIVNSPSGQTIAVLKFKDTLDDKTNSIWSQNGSLLLLAGPAAGVKITDSSGTTNWFQVNADDGATYLYGSGITSNSTPYLDASKQLKSSPTGTATLDFGSTAAQTSSELTIAVTGAIVGDCVVLGIPATTDANSCYTARVSSSDVVTVKFNNYSAAPIDPASGSFKATIIK